MSIDRIYAGEIAMASVLAASVTDRRKSSRALERSCTPERTPKRARSLWRTTFRNAKSFFLTRG